MQNNQVRIIGGQWRSRLVAFPPRPGLRPTPDRVRETLFNWLRDDLPGARCLDLFAGSGILGFEALSRGAAKLVQIEQDPQTSHHLRESAKSLGCESATQCLTTPAANWIAAHHDSPDQFDIIFLDPPFSSPDDSLLLQTCSLLAASQIPAPHAKIYIESPTPIPQDALPDPWQIIKSKKASQVHYTLATRK